MLRHLKLKLKIKTKTISRCLFFWVMRTYYKIIKLFGLKIELNIELNVLPACDDRCIKTKIKSSGNNIYTNFRASIVLEGDIECKSFTVISIESLLVYKNKYCLQVYLDKSVNECLKSKQLRSFYSTQV